MYNEDMLFSFYGYFINSVLSGWYIQKMHSTKYRNTVGIIIWMILYFAVQYAVSEISEAVYPLCVVGDVTIRFLTFFALGNLFFCGSLTAKVFISISFVTGAEIVKIISSALSAVLIDLSNLLFVMQGNIIQNDIKLLHLSLCIILAICILIRSGLFFCYLHIIVKQEVEIERKYHFHESLFLILPGFTVLCTAVLFRMVIISVENEISGIIFSRIPATKFWIPFICLLLLGMLLSSVYLFQKMLQRNQEEKKRLLLENQISQMQREVLEIQDIYADMRSLRHDLRGHLANISALMKEKTVNRDVLPEYIGKMERTLERLEFPSQTGNPITDVIIRRKCQEAERKQIPLQIDFIFPVGQKIDAYDIGIILDNILTNAIEACSANTSSIFLRSYAKGNLFFIEAENVFEGEIIWNEKTGLPISSKKDGSIHGVGLSSVRRCAQKYHGDIDIEISFKNGEKRFRLTIMMCSKDFTP